MMLNIKIQTFLLLLRLSSDYVDLVQCTRSTLLDQTKDLCPRVTSITNYKG